MFELLITVITVVTITALVVAGAWALYIFFCKECSFCGEQICSICKGCYNELCENRCDVFEDIDGEKND